MNFAATGQLEDGFPWFSSENEFSFNFLSFMWQSSHIRVQQ